MHRLDKDGNHNFEGKRKNLTGSVLEVYVFEKENFAKHEFRHRITDDKSLNEIDKTIFDPDVETQGPKTIQRNFYRVASYIDSRRGRALFLWRVHCYRKKEDKRYFIIATAFQGVSSPTNAIHYLETAVWRKTDSKI